MENASKALIIAGAILLSILIIALGVYIFNMAKSSINTDTLDSLDISTFNSQFTQYEGDQLGSSVKSLLTAIIASNNENKDADDRLINVCFYNSDNTTKPNEITNTDEAKSGADNAIAPAINNVQSSNVSNLSASLSTTHHYYVRFYYDDEGTGYVKTCAIFYNS